MIEIILKNGKRMTDYAGVVRTREELIAYIRGNGLIDERVAYCLPLSEINNPQETILQFIEPIEQALREKTRRRVR